MLSEYFECMSSVFTICLVYLCWEWHLLISGIFIHLPRAKWRSIFKQSSISFLDSWMIVVLASGLLRSAACLYFILVTDYDLCLIRMEIRNIHLSFWCKAFIAITSRFSTCCSAFLSSSAVTEDWLDKRLSCWWRPSFWLSCASSNNDMLSSYSS